MKLPAILASVVFLLCAPVRADEISDRHEAEKRASLLSKTIQERISKIEIERATRHAHSTGDRPYGFNLSDLDGSKR